MIRALVADDEKDTAALLSELLEATGKVQVVGQARDGASCLKLLQQHRPDVLFLDVRMPRMTGVELAEAAAAAGLLPLTVFVTGHDEYAVKAFELAAVDYIVKPVDLEDLEERIGDTVARLEQALAQREPSLAALHESVRDLLSRQEPAPTRRLPVKDYEEGTVRLIEPSSVVYVEREGAQVTLYTHAKAFRTYHTIDRLEERLREAGFFRASRAALLNTSYVQHLIPNGDGSYDAVLDVPGGKVITVSRARSKDLLASLGL